MSTTDTTTDGSADGVNLAGSAPRDYPFVDIAIDDWARPNVADDLVLLVGVGIDYVHGFGPRARFAALAENGVPISTVLSISNRTVLDLRFTPPAFLAEAAMMEHWPMLVLARIIMVDSRRMTLEVQVETDTGMVALTVPQARTLDRDAASSRINISRRQAIYRMLRAEFADQAPTGDVHA